MKTGRKNANPWTEYTSWLKANAPKAFANLAPPASAKELAALEAGIGKPLPKEVRQLLTHNNGQRRPAGCRVLPGLRLLSSKRILAEWKTWATLRKSEASHLDEHDAACSSLDPGVQPVYTHPAWIPLFQDDDRSDYFGVDLAPTRDGKRGQVINFGRDENDHFVAFTDLDAFIAFWLGEARAGRCQAAPAEEGGGEDFVHRSGNSIDVLRKPARERAKKRRPQEAKPAANEPWKPPVEKGPARSSTVLALVPNPERDRGPRYEQLDDLDREFLKRLAADKRPRAKYAVLWHEGLRLDNKGGPAWTRGDDSLHYREANKKLGDVPGPDLPKDKLPFAVCKSLIMTHMRSRQGPRSIAFQYQRGSDGVWRGGYAVETQKRYLEFLKATKPFEEKLLGALKALLDDRVVRAGVTFGSPSRDKEGPQLVIHRTGDQYSSFHDLSGEQLDCWNAYIEHLQREGIQRVLDLAIRVERVRPKAPVIERAMVLYCR